LLAVEPGLRERKKRDTRTRIVAAAFDLCQPGGYAQATLQQIAEAADVSPRTIFAYYENKEDILFCEEGAFLDRLTQMLDERPAETTTIDAIRSFLSSLPPADEEARLRKKIVSANPELEMGMRARHSQLEPMLAESIAKDLGAAPDDIRPLLIAASMTAAFTSVRDRLFEAEAGGEPLSHQEAMAVLDQVLEFTRAGVAALQRD